MLHLMYQLYDSETVNKIPCECVEMIYRDIMCRIQLRTIHYTNKKDVCVRFIGCDGIQCGVDKSLFVKECMDKACEEVMKKEAKTRRTLKNILKGSPITLTKRKRPLEPECDIFMPSLFGLVQDMANRGNLI